LIWCDAHSKNAIRRGATAIDRTAYLAEFTPRMMGKR
jgi:hypothetical protein